MHVNFDSFTARSMASPESDSLHSTFILCPLSVSYVCSHVVQAMIALLWLPLHAWAAQPDEAYRNLASAFASAPQGQSAASSASTMLGPLMQRMTSAHSACYFCAQSAQHTAQASSRETCGPSSLTHSKAAPWTTSFMPITPLSPVATECSCRMTWNLLLEHCFSCRWPSSILHLAALWSLRGMKFNAKAGFGMATLWVDWPRTARTSKWHDCFLQLRKVGQFDPSYRRNGFECVSLTTDWWSCRFSSYNGLLSLDEESYALLSR